MMNSLSKRIIACTLAAWLIGLAPLALAQPAEELAGVDIAELSPQTERAIDRALTYLAGKQNADGSWGGKYKMANTATSLMAFMLKGHFPGRGRYGEPLDRAVDWMLEQGRQHDGYLGGRQHGMYEHGLATLALSEAWGEAPQDDIRDALKAAVDVIFRAQHPSGGWRYEPQPKSHDISVTVMQVVALASAREAGILVPDQVLRDALGYVRDCQHPFEGGFTYQPRSGNPALPRSAAGVMSYHMLGEGDSRAAQRGLDYLLRREDKKFDSSSHYFYAHYYAIQVMYQSGDAYYQKWYPQIRDALLGKQHNEGYWRGGRGGTEYSTAMAVLILGVPYRYLPIYQR